MGHVKRDCFERPRKTGARFTETNIAADDYVATDMDMNYDAKRDRWNGYDPADYRQVVEEHERMEETRKLIRAKNVRS